MFKNALLTAMLTMTPLAAQAQMTPAAEMPSGTYNLDPTHASLTWKVSHFGLSKYTARFTKLNATIVFDAKDVTKSTLTATVDPTSVKTDYPYPDKKNFDQELATGKTWFNSAQFPEIKFVSTKIEKTGDDTARIFGDLSFLGVTKPLILETKLNGAYGKHPMAGDASFGFSATAKLKRSEWGFSTYIPNLGDEVTLLIETEFHKAP